MIVFSMVYDGPGENQIPLSRFLAACVPDHHALGTQARFLADYMLKRHLVTRSVVPFLKNFSISISLLNKKKSQCFNSLFFELMTLHQMNFAADTFCPLPSPPPPR